MTLSIVISAYNEEKKIEDCLKSASFADEIILVDNSSNDRTVEIAKKYAPKIFTRANNTMLNVNKNFGLGKKKCDWVLNLDADERISPELQTEIKKTLKNPSAEGYWLPRKNIIFGKWIQSDFWWPDYQLRLFKKNKGKFPEKHVHEYLKVEGETQKLQHPLVHENYSSIDQFIYKMLNIYTGSEVKNRIENKVEITWVDALRYPIDDFLKTFFAQRGYKDGLHGLVLSILQAFYMEIVFVKLWEERGFKEENPGDFLQKIHREFRKIKKEFSYWFLTSYINNTKNPLKKIIYRVARKKVS